MKAFDGEASNVKGVMPMILYSMSFIAGIASLAVVMLCLEWVFSLGEAVSTTAAQAECINDRVILALHEHEFDEVTNE